MANPKSKLFAGPALAILLLAVLLGLNQTHLSPEDAEGYHAAVRKAVLAIPRQIDGWNSADQEIPQAAIALLKPNILFSRRYTHQITGQAITLLIVHCKDSRDLMGHYPPVCYPGQGWRIIDNYDHGNRLFENAQPTGDWALYPMIHGSTQTGRVAQLVYNQMLLPDGTTTSDMGRVRAIAGDFHRRHFGAAAVQIIVNEELRVSEDVTIQPLLDVLVPITEAIFSTNTLEND